VGLLSGRDELGLTRVADLFITSLAVGLGAQPPAANAVMATETD